MPNTIVTQLFGAILPWIVLFGLLSILGAAFRVFFLPKIKGHIGEACVNFQVKRYLEPSVYRRIPNVMLPTPEGTTQIDHVIVSRYGIFVMETKSYKGWIFGGERDAQWTQVNFKRKDRFQNPLRQNYKHTKTLSDLTGIPHEHFKSLVIFAGECKFKTAMPANVVHIRDFIRHVKGHQTPIIQDEQVPVIVDVIGKWTDTISNEQRQQHVRNRQPVQAKASTLACPQCGTTIVLRTNRKEGNQFWGCPKYPQCRGTRQVG